MTEWGVVCVIVALVGLGLTVGKPIVTLNTTIAKLTVLVDELRNDLKVLSEKNSESHGRLWAHNEKQDQRIEDHENRIIVLEQKEG